MSATEELLANNRAYAQNEHRRDAPAEPVRRVAVVACMDARIHVSRVLGLEPGDAHIIRNAGGVVTDDTIRSLLISQRLLGTEEVILMHHTGCGMLSFTDDALKAEIEQETGIRPPFALEAFTDLDADVRQSMARVRASPLLPYRGRVRGFVFDVDTGLLREVQDAARQGAT